MKRTASWPLSTPERPKPFLPLLGERTLLQLTAARLDGLVADDDIHVVTDRRYGDLVRAQLPGASVIEEPTGRNTAAAVALATVAIARPDDDVMVILPADHDIEREDVFRGVIADADLELARGAFDIESPLVTLGTQVTRPATEYGYLIPDRERGVRRRLMAYPLTRFQEKPDQREAERLMSESGVAWNAGMFIWRRRAIRAALARYADDVYGAIAGAVSDDRLDLEYPSVRSTSIDRAVMEPASQDGIVVMGAMDVGWSDLGSWSALLADLGAGEVVGRVVQAGESAALGPSDLAVLRRGGHLVIEAGPGRIADEPGPSALLEGAAPARAVVDDLVARVTAAER